MADVTVTVSVGERQYEVACQPGEESFLQSAAGLLDAEAQALSEGIGRMPESQMLLMSGLVLADKSADSLERIAALETELAATQKELAAARKESAAARAEAERLGSQPAPEPREVEVAHVPPQVVETLADLTARAEAAAEAVEARAAG